MRTRQEDLRTTLFAAHVVNVSAHTIAVLEVFARDQFVTTDNRLATPKIDNNVAVLHALDGTVDDLADAILVLVVLAITLSFTNLLDDDLLGRLSSNTAELHRRQLFGDEITDL